MKEDWDYVSLPNYNKDMSDLAALGASAVSHYKKENDRLMACIAALVKAAGRISIPQDFDFTERPKFEVSRDEYHGTFVFRTFNN